MRIHDWHSLDPQARAAALSRPSACLQAEVVQVAREVIAEVRTSGDAALRSLTARFDGAMLSALQVSPAEFAQAREAVAPAARQALERAIANVSRFHAAQCPTPLTVETEPGVRCELLPRPIEAVGLYVPGGTAPLPSAVIMLAVPALLAGCERRAHVHAADARRHRTSGGAPRRGAV